MSRVSQAGRQAGSVGTRKCETAAEVTATLCVCCSCPCSPAERQPSEGDAGSSAHPLIREQTEGLNVEGKQNNKQRRGKTDSVRVAEEKGGERKTEKVQKLRNEEMEK